MAPTSKDSIGEWTPAQLVRFIQNMLREHPPTSANNLTVEIVNVTKQLNCKDQIQIFTSVQTPGTTGTATALPANPKGYFKFLDYTGNVVLVPYYNS